MNIHEYFIQINYTKSLYMIHYEDISFIMKTFSKSKIKAYLAFYFDVSKY